MKPELIFLPIPTRVGACDAIPKACTYGADLNEPADQAAEHGRGAIRSVGDDTFG